MLLVMMISANEYTKENHTEGGQMVDKSGHTVAMAGMEALIKHDGILDMPAMTPESLNSIKDVHFPVRWKTNNAQATFSSRVVGYMQQDKTRLTVFLAAPAPNGDKAELFIQPGKAYLLGKGGKVVGNVVLAATAAAKDGRRRLGGGRGKARLLPSPLPEPTVGSASMDAAALADALELARAEKADMKKQIDQMCREKAALERRLAEMAQQ